MIQNEINKDIKNLNKTPNSSARSSISFENVDQSTSIQNTSRRKRNYSSGYYTSTMDSEGIQFNDDTEGNKKMNQNNTNQSENEIKSKQNQKSQSLSNNVEYQKEKNDEVEEIEKDFARPNLLRDKIMQLPISNFYKKYLLFYRDF